jgi:hypothetical protein
MTVFITLPDGQSVRDFLVLPTIRFIRTAVTGLRVVALSPAHLIPGFREMCKSQDIVAARMELCTDAERGACLRALRRHRIPGALSRLALRLEAGCIHVPDYITKSFEADQPDLVLSTNPMTPYEYEVVTVARRLGVRTLGVAKSWDDFQRHRFTHPDEVSVRNSSGRDNAIRRCAYRPGEVAINGMPSFDPYYDSSWHLDRSEFLTNMGLDPGRPLVTYATRGLRHGAFWDMDETCLVDDLLRMIDTTPTLRDAQLLVSLHPNSRLEDFQRFHNRPGTVLSNATFMPAIGWCPSRDDIVTQTNILRHSSAVVTPGLSWVIESAVFDTPAVVPAYSEIQPLQAEERFHDLATRKHFLPLVENRWVPICTSYEDCRAELTNAITNPGAFRQQRKAIVDSYVHFQDARSCQRVANWISERLTGTPRARQVLEPSRLNRP